MTLRELRKTREFSQETLVDVLGMRQGDLSKLERRAVADLRLCIAWTSVNCFA
jgi:transcriptional regulator with XRE-family HTH domain